MPCITKFTKNLDFRRADSAFRALKPDSILTLDVRPSRFQNRINPNPYQAGQELHGLLPCLGNDQPLSERDKGYFPYLATLRGHLRRIGVTSLVPEQPLTAVAPIGHGKCDLLVRGGLARKGVVEIKVLHECPDAPRGIHLAQTGLYARLIAGWSDFEDVWAALAYMDLQRHTIDVMCFKNARQLIFRAVDLWEQAA
jgi:hypothetical protein